MTDLHIHKHPPIAIEPVNSGTLTLCLAKTEADIQHAQALRYAVFVEEKGAKVSEEMHVKKQDWDEFDPYCDHLLVWEHEGEPRVVGTYRLLRRENMQEIGRFYTASEFDISAIEAFSGPILELGRSCVHPDYRSRAVMQLLWRGIGAFINAHNIELMFGCASFHGIDLKEHARSLSYLYHYHASSEGQANLKALPERYVEMNLMPKEDIAEKEAFNELPALIKGYLRLGGYISDGAVIDAEYNTVDVGVVVKTELVGEKYAQRYRDS